MPHGKRDPEIVQRSFDFALRILKLCDHLDARGKAARRIADQLVRSGTSVGANLEEAQGAPSKADFINKNFVALKEARETCYWLRLVGSADYVEKSRLHPLLDEAKQITLIVGAIASRARRNKDL